MPVRCSYPQQSILPTRFSRAKYQQFLTKFQSPNHTPNCERPHVLAIYRHIFSGVCKSSNSEKIPKVRANKLKKLEDAPVNQTLIADQADQAGPADCRDDNNAPKKNKSLLLGRKAR